MSNQQGFLAGQPPNPQGFQFNAGPQPGFPSQYPSQQSGPYVPQQPGQYPSQQAGPYAPQQPGQYPSQQAGPYVPQQPGQYPSQQAGPYAPQQPGGYPTKQLIQNSPGAWDPSQAKKYDGEIPDDDVDENSAQEPNQPSAPPPVDITLAGYEGVGYAAENPVGPPPGYTESIADTRIDSSAAPLITAEDAKEALKEYVSQQCCYGSGAAEDMSIKDIKSSSAFHYSLETFTESRTTAWHYAPYSGGMIDGPHMGPAPAPWEIPCACTQLFKNEVKKLEVPHTTSVRLCHICHGQGFERCWRCMGRGMVRCAFCNGRGTRLEFRDGVQQQVPCSSCNGSGRKRCFTCSGLGCTRCLVCRGFGQIKQYIRLTVTFKNEVTDHIIERTMMPDELIRDAEGDTILEQVAIRVGPVVGFFDNEINQRSCAIVQEHASAWPNSRILQQRQRLRGVPVYECDFKFDGERGKFWVYGKQRAVYTKDYPHTCCCCKCVIL